MVWSTLDRRTSQARPEESAVLSKELRRQIELAAERYPVKRGALLPALHLVQKYCGHISDRAMVELAGLLEISPSEVLDALTCYSHLHRQPLGRHMILVCRGLACEVCGSGELLAALKQKLGIDEDQTTLDGRFTLKAEECMGACDKAPYLTVDWESYGPVKIDQLETILSKYT